MTCFHLTPPRIPYKRAPDPIHTSYFTINMNIKSFVSAGIIKDGSILY